MTIEIVDFPIENGDFPLLCDSLPQGILHVWTNHDKPRRLTADGFTEPWLKQIEK